MQRIGGTAKWKREVIFWVIVLTFMCAFLMRKVYTMRENYTELHRKVDFIIILVQEIKNAI